MKNLGPLVHSSRIIIQTRGFSTMVDITAKVSKIVNDSRIADGIATIFVIGSTASISTIEFEPALAQDFQDQIDKLIPHDLPTRHGKTWGDDNGFSHLRATLMGPGITVPVCDGCLTLGTWQQIVVVDHDNRARSREVVIQVVGDTK